MSLEQFWAIDNACRKALIEQSEKSMATMIFDIAGAF
jgi:hypothetical protein